MGAKLAYIQKNKICINDNGTKRTLDSQYLNRYKKNREEIRKKNEWKTTGLGAIFRGDAQFGANESIDDFDKLATVNGITLIEDENKIIYTVSIENSTAIMQIDDDNNQAIESHIVHDTDKQFSNIEYSPLNNKLVFALKDGIHDQHIALINDRNSYYQVITEGDTLDDNPTWDKTFSNVLYYDSKGIARDYHDNFMDFGPSVINRLDLEKGELEELVSSEKFDYFKPKCDYDGNLYFMKKPYEPLHKGFNIFKFILDVILFPFRLLRAFIVFFNFFSMRYTGKPLSSSGNNPSKSKQADPQQVFINGNLIQAEKELKKNQSRGSKYPGIAPYSWELVKMDRNSNMQTICTGVLDYDIDKDGNIIYSNGKYIMKIDKNSSKEEMLVKDELIQKIRAI